MYANDFFDSMTEKAFKEFNATGIIKGKIYLLATTPGMDDCATICETDTPVKNFDDSIEKTLKLLIETKKIMEKFVDEVKEDGHQIMASVHVEPVIADNKMKIIVIRAMLNFTDSKEYEVDNNRIEVGEGGVIIGMNPYNFVEIENEN